MRAVTWERTTVGELAIVSGGLTKNGTRNSLAKRLPYLRVANVYSNRLDLADVAEIGVSDSELDRVLLRKGDLLIVEGNGSVDQIGRVAEWNGAIDSCVHQNHLIKVRCHPSTFGPWLLYWLLSPEGRDAVVKTASSTSGLHTLSISKVRALPAVLAPIAEQRRIVAEIEKQFTRLDDAVATLKRVQANLERARASVLKAAVEGRLVPTEAELARAEGRSYEPASVLLERILEERKRKHDEAQAGAKRKTKYKPPVAPDLDGLPELPEGWTWASVDQALENHDGARVPIKREDRGTRRGDFLYYGASGPIDTIDGYTHEGSYLLVGEDGANLVTRTKPIAFQAQGRFWVNNHAHVLLPYLGMPLGYFEAHFNGMDISQYITGSAQPKLPQRAMNKMPIALPPFREQVRIVREVERRLSVMSEIRTVVKRNLTRCERLRQSILKRAFEGKLVPQDPTDEPAAELLARIQSS